MKIEYFCDTYKILLFPIYKMGVLFWLRNITGGWYGDFLQTFTMWEGCLKASNFTLRNMWIAVVQKVNNFGLANVSCGRYIELRRK